MPTLVSTSKFDLTVPSNYSREIADVIAGAQYVVLPESGHVALMETPEAFAKVCLEFLDRVAG